MEKLTEFVNQYKSQEVKDILKLHEAAGNILDLISQADMKIHLKIESQAYWVKMFDIQNPKYNHEKEIAEMAKKRLMKSYTGILNEIILKTR